MWVSFESLAPTSRVWIYQVSRALTGEEKKVIVEVMQDFCEGWAAHGDPLKCSFKIDHDHFLILSVDEAWSGASGCSIDGSVKTLKALGERLDLDFFDRMFATFLQDGVVKTIFLKNLRQSITDGIITPTTPAFNTLAATISDLEKNWTLPLEKTWLSKYIPKTTLA